MDMDLYAKQIEAEELCRKTGALVEMPRDKIIIDREKGETGILYADGSYISKQTLDKAIKHFESLQKRYTTQHNGKMCDYVDTALTAMRHVLK